MSSNDATYKHIPFAGLPPHNMAMVMKKMGTLGITRMCKMDRTSNYVFTWKRKELSAKDCSQCAVLLTDSRHNTQWCGCCNSHHTIRLTIDTNLKKILSGFAFRDYYLDFSEGIDPEVYERVKDELVGMEIHFQKMSLKGMAERHILPLLSSLWKCQEISILWNRVYSLKLISQVSFFFKTVTFEQATPAVFQRVLEMLSFTEDKGKLETIELNCRQPGLALLAYPNYERDLTAMSLVFEQSETSWRRRICSIRVLDMESHYAIVVFMHHGRWVSQNIHILDKNYYAVLDKIEELLFGEDGVRMVGDKRTEFVGATTDRKKKMLHEHANYNYECKQEREDAEDDDDDY